MLEIAEVIRQAGPAYWREFASRMLASHFQVLRDLVQCRTPARGGHVRQCDQCDERRYSYHSCRNRHCPKCQGPETKRWLQSRRAMLLDCPYFLVTFTLPAQLRELTRSHQKTVYSALMRAGADALLQLAKDPGFLGGSPGMLGVLHTWTRELHYHPHAHFLVTGGGLSADGQAWRKTSYPEFLMPQYVLSMRMRENFKKALARIGLLDLAPRRAWRTRWVVDVGFAGSGQEVLAYLARYVHRVALPNSRLERFENGQVTFRYRESRTQELRRCTLSAEEFLRRFLQHVLPKGFMKVRSYGLFASACRKDLQKAQQLLDLLRQVESTATGDPPAEEQPVLAPDTTSDEDPDPVCPACGIGRLRLVEILAPERTLPPCARGPPPSRRLTPWVSSAVER